MKVSQLNLKSKKSVKQKAMSKFDFKKIDYWGQTADELIEEAKANSALLFDTEKTAIKNYRVGNLQRLKYLNEILRLPEKDEHFRLITHNAFNAFSWIDFLCDKFTSFEEVYITSYNFGEAPINILFEKFDSGIFEKLRLVISESIRFRMPKRFFQLKEGVEQRKDKNLKMAGVWNHSKIILMRPKLAEAYFVIEGSGNFSENAYIEQYSFDNSEQIYNFHRSWIDEYVFNPETIEKKRHFIY